MSGFCRRGRWNSQETLQGRRASLSLEDEEEDEEDEQDELSLVRPSRVKDQREGKGIVEIGGIRHYPFSKGFGEMLSILADQ
jgi:hypothetical protein